MAVNGVCQDRGKGECFFLEYPKPEGGDSLSFPLDGIPDLLSIQLHVTCYRKLRNSQVISKTNENLISYVLS